MGIRSIHRPQRHWPAVVLLLGSTAAVVAALAGDSAATTVAAVLFVLSATLLFVMARRDQRGATANPMAFRAALAAAGLAFAVLLVLAPVTVVGFVLAAIAVLFALAVLLLGVIVVLTSLTDPPAWMLDEDGNLGGLRERVAAAVRHWTRRAEERPDRSPQKVYGQISRDMRRMVWHAGADDSCAFSHFHVVVHPETERSLDGWMPIEDVAEELAQGYATAQQGTRRRSSQVLVLISSDPAVPVGVGAVAASFREPRADAPKARALARLDGPVHALGLDAQRMGPAVMAVAGGDTRRMASGEAALVEGAVGDLLVQDADRTQIRAAEPLAEEPTVVARQPGTLTLRRCSVNGTALADAEVHTLSADRSWIVGRGVGADILVREPQISRQHLHFIHGEDGWCVVDRSSSGSSSNDVPLATGEATPVRPGDVLELGTKAPTGLARVLLLAL